MRILVAVLCLVSFPVLANEIPCTQGALHAELERINDCEDYVSPCDVTGRTITFDCGTTTIYLDQDLVDGTADGNASSEHCFPFCTHALSQGCGAPGSNCEDSDPNPEMCVPDTGCAGSDTAPCTNADLACTGGAGNPWQCCTATDAGDCCPEVGSKTGPVGRWERDIDVDDVTIDGEGNITFELDPPCWQSVGEGTNTEVENGPWLFRVFGDNVTIQDITYNNFFEGIQWFGDNGQLLDITSANDCDDAFDMGTISEGGPGKNMLVDNATVSNGTDKCFQMGSNASTTGTDYVSEIRNSTFTDCKTVTFNAGRHWFHDNIITAAGTQDTADYYDPKGLRSVFGAVVYIQDNQFIGGSNDQFSLWYGIWAEAQGTIISLGGNEVANCNRTGVLAEDTSNIVLQRDKIHDNGGLNDGAGRRGGVVAQSGAYIDAGGGSKSLDGGTVASEGGNWFWGNFDYQTAINFKTTSSEDTFAVGVRWGFPCVTDPSSKIDDSSTGEPPAELTYLPVWCSSGILIVN